MPNISIQGYVAVINIEEGGDGRREGVDVGMEAALEVAKGIGMGYWEKVGEGLIWEWKG